MKTRLLISLYCILKQNIFPTSKHSKRARKAEKEDPIKGSYHGIFVIRLEKESGFYILLKERKKKEHDRETIVHTLLYKSAIRNVNTG